MALALRHPVSRIRFATLRLSLGLVTVVALSGAAHAAASEEGEILRLRGENLAAQGRCNEALSVLERARAAAPQDARIPLRSGQCLIQQKRYPDAVAALEEAQRLDPTLADVPLHLGIARYHLGDLAGAEAALAQARERTPGRAEVDLYQGLIQLQRAEGRGAAASLERARRADPRAVEPVASYYEGLAWSSAAERARAREALERVKREAPGTPWADAAQRELERLAGADRDERVWVSVTGGVEYDDNVVLRGSSVTLPDEIAGQSDPRLVWSAEAGWEFLRFGDWSAGTIVSYYGSAHEDLADFNVQYPEATLWLDRRLGDATTARLQYDFGYAWVGADPFLTNHTLTPALFQSWGDAGVTRLFVEYERDNYRFSNKGGPAGPGDPPGPPSASTVSQRNRDGYEIETGVDHVLPLAIGWDGVALRGGYHYHYYSARGSEYSWQGHEAILGARAALPWKLALDLEGRFLYAPYRNASTFPAPGTTIFLDERRSDEVYSVEASLERPLTDQLTAAVRYAFINNESNVQVFDYNRYIVGAYLTFRWKK